MVIGVLRRVVKTPLVYLGLGKSESAPLAKPLSLEGFHLKLGVLQAKPFVIEQANDCTANSCYSEPHNFLFLKVKRCRFA